MIRYQAFGLSIRSELPLWPREIAFAGSGNADVEVRFGRASPPPGARFSLTATETEAVVEGYGSIRAASGTSIEVLGEPAVDEATLASCASGPGLAMVLHQRGALVLHGSCIAIGGRAICVAGPSGAGKSTIAGAALRRGHRLVSDGMTAVFRDGGGIVRAAIGPRCARLWPDAAEHLGFDSSSLACVLPGSDKRICALADVDLEPVALAGVLETSPGDRVGIELIAGSAALMTLVKNSFLVEYLDEPSAPLLLAQCAGVCETARVGRLSRGSSLPDLDDVIALLERFVDNGGLSGARDAGALASGR